MLERKGRDPQEYTKDLSRKNIKRMNGNETEWIADSSIAPDYINWKNFCKRYASAGRKSYNN
jgi:hypothetical protein